MNKSNLDKSIRFYNDAVDCEKIGNLKANKITNGENLIKFLSRVGFSANESTKIISSIKSQKQSLDLKYKVVRIRMKWFIHLK